MTNEQIGLPNMAMINAVHWLPCHSYFYLEVVSVITLHPNNYGESMSFIVIYWGLALVDFNHVFEDYFKGTGTIIWLP